MRPLVRLEGGQTGEPGIWLCARNARRAGKILIARKMANHAESRTTQIDDRRADEPSLDEYEKVGI